MSGICGFVGDAAPGVVERMLSAIDYRGDSQDVVALPGASFGYRFWAGRPGKAPAVLRTARGMVASAGAFASPSHVSAAEVVADLMEGQGTFEEVDGAFAFAHFDASERVLTLDAGKVSHDVAVSKAELEYERFAAVRGALPSEVEKHFEDALKDVKRLAKSTQAAGAKKTRKKG